jgi:S1-C subfamily serine protease
LAALSRILGSTQRVPATALRPGAVVGVRGDARGAVKGVPFHDQGRVVGFRVTGVRPGSWAHDYGLCEGDVIEAIEGLAVTGEVDANALLRQDFAPSALSVRRGQDRRVLGRS